MLKEPLNIKNAIKLFLDFKNDGFGRMLINEDVGFDTLNLQLEQGKNRYGRDFIFSTSDLTIHKKINPKAFEKLKEYIDIYGFESEIDYIIQEDNEDYKSGTIDIDLSESDLLTYIKFSLSEETNRTLIKRKGKTKINLLSNEDLEGNAIDPIQTENILLKAKPVQVSSAWTLIPNFFLFTGFNLTLNETYQNPIKTVTQFNIQNTLSWFPNSALANNLTLSQNENDFKIIEAKNDLTNNVISFENIVIKYLIPEGDPFLDTLTVAVNWISGLNRIQFRYFIGADPAPDFYPESLILNYNYEYTRTIDAEPYGRTGELDEYVVTIPNQQFEIENISRDNCLYGLFNLGRRLTVTDWVSGEIKITSTSTGIDSIIKGVRYIDAIKQTVKSINGNTVNAPKFDINGVFYDNYIANGNLIRGIENESFTTTFSDLTEQLQEFNADYQANDDNIEIAQYQDFYNDIEIESYKLLPNVNFTEGFNNRYLLNTFEFEYKIYETDKDEQNTKDSIHTSTQWNLPNNRAKETKNIKIPFFRDPNKWEFLRQKNDVSDGTTALSDDKNIGILDVIPLAPGTQRTINAILTHNIDVDGILQLLNDGSFNWAIRGFNVGDTFEILEGFNVGTFIVVGINNNVLSLESTTGTPFQQGAIFTKVRYQITNTFLTNRTNEGFNLIEGVANSENYSNLKYTIKRNINFWESYLNTSLQYKPNSVITNTEFINGGNVTTQLIDENIVVENELIQKNDLDNAILSAKIVNTSLIVNFSEHDKIIKGIINQKGFIRVSDTNKKMLKIFPRKTNYIWAKNLLEIEGEILLESQFLEISKIGGIVKIGRTGYNTSLVYPINFETDNDYIQIFDKRYVPLSNKKRFDFVKVNNIQYSNIEDLANAISEL